MLCEKFLRAMLLCNASLYGRWVDLLYLKNAVHRPETIGKEFIYQLQLTPLLLMGKSLPHRVPGNNSTTAGAKHVSRNGRSNVLALTAYQSKGRRVVVFFDSLLVAIVYRRNRSIHSSLSMRFLEKVRRLHNSVVFNQRRATRCIGLLFARDGTKGDIHTKRCG